VGKAGLFSHHPPTFSQLNPPSNPPFPTSRDPARRVVGALSTAPVTFPRSAGLRPGDFPFSFYLFPVHFLVLDSGFSWLFPCPIFTISLASSRFNTHLPVHHTAGVGQRLSNLKFSFPRVFATECESRNLTFECWQRHHSQPESGRKPFNLRFTRHMKQKPIEVVAISPDSRALNAVCRQHKMLPPNGFRNTPTAFSAFIPTF